MTGQLGYQILKNSSQKELRCFTMETREKRVYVLQADQHGPYDLSPFDPFEGKQCEVHGVIDGPHFMVKKVRTIDGEKIEWCSQANKRCPQCLMTLFADCIMCPFCGAKP